MYGKSCSSDACRFSEELLLNMSQQKGDQAHQCGQSVESAHAGCYSIFLVVICISLCLPANTCSILAEKCNCLLRVRDVSNSRAISLCFPKKVSSHLHMHTVPQARQLLAFKVAFLNSFILVYHLQGLTEVCLWFSRFHRAYTHITRTMNLIQCFYSVLPSFLHFRNLITENINKYTPYSM